MESNSEFRSAYLHNCKQCWQRCDQFSSFKHWTKFSFLSLSAVYIVYNLIRQVLLLQNSIYASGQKCRGGHKQALYKTYLCFMCIEFTSCLKSHILQIMKSHLHSLPYPHNRLFLFQADVALNAHVILCFLLQRREFISCWPCLNIMMLNLWWTLNNITENKDTHSSLLLSPHEQALTFLHIDLPKYYLQE